MSAQQSEDDTQVKRCRDEKTPKPTLMKSYAAVSDDDLQGIVGKIRSITRSADARGTAPAVVAREVEPPPAQLDQPIDQPVDHSIDQSLGQSTNQSAIWPNERPNASSIDTSIDASNAIDAGSSPHRVIVFNLNQAILYQCIYWLEGQTTSLQRIGQVTGISAFTLKHCLRKLRQVGAIEYHGPPECSRAHGVLSHGPAVRHGFAGRRTPASPASRRNQARPAPYCKGR